MGLIATAMSKANGTMIDLRERVEQLETEHAAMERILTAQKGKAPERPSEGGGWKLGDFIAALEKLKPDAAVAMEFCGLKPTSFASYRGYYDQLALGFEREPGYVQAGELLEAAKACVAKAFTGWKGGDYLMNRDTELWVANPGHANSVRVVGLKVEGDEKEWAYIQTARED